MKTPQEIEEFFYTINRNNLDFESNYRSYRVVY
jgi:hypothetical protein